MDHDPRTSLSPLARALAAMAAVVVTCSLFFGVIAGMAGDPWSAAPVDVLAESASAP